MFSVFVQWISKFEFLLLTKWIPGDKVSGLLIEMAAGSFTNAEVFVNSATPA
jgi:hypothetical protein